MPETVKIQHGATLQNLTLDDLDKALGDAGDSWGYNYFQELARGVKPIRFLGFGTVSGGSITIGGSPGTSDGLGGPEQGLVWGVRRLSVDGLGTNDVLKVYRSVVDPANYIGALIPGSGSRMKFGSTEFLLLPNDQIIITGTGLTATGQLVVNGEGIEVPAFAISKLL